MAIGDAARYTASGRWDLEARHGTCLGIGALNIHMHDITLPSSCKLGAEEKTSARYDTLEAELWRPRVSSAGDWLVPCVNLVTSHMLLCDTARRCSYIETRRRSLTRYLCAESPCPDRRRVSHGLPSLDWGLIEMVAMATSLTLPFLLKHARKTSGSHVLEALPNPRPAALLHMPTATRGFEKALLSRQPSSTTRVGIQRVG